MLDKGIIPDKEPIVRVGIHLPQDESSTMTIEFPEPELFEITTNGSPISIQTELNLRVKDGYIDSGQGSNKNISKLSILRKDQCISLEHGPIIHSVFAGRGFHWQKKISVQLPGNIIIKIRDGFLFTVNKVPLEQYLMCVATSEMSAKCPGALLEAQTIAARSWVLAASEKKHVNLGIDNCNDDCCQRYQGIANQSPAAIRASLSTKGKVLIANERICDTRYSKCCGGRTEDNESVWNTDPRSYLRSVFDGPEDIKNGLSDEGALRSWFEQKYDCYCGPKYVSVDDINKFLGKVDEIDNYYRWSVHYTQEEMVKTISKKTGDRFSSITGLTPVLRGRSGRIVKLRIDGRKNGEYHSVLLQSEYQIRKALSPDFLYSSAFIIETNSSKDKGRSEFTLHGAGWGHGVGLCQIGALGMALANHDSKSILSHYYQSSALIKIYD